MTVQVGFEWDLLEQEMPPIPCEHTGHSTDHVEGPATHYLTYHCPTCKRHVDAQACCADWVAYVQGNGLIRCRGCRRIHSASMSTTILGPIH